MRALPPTTRVVGLLLGLSALVELAWSAVAGAEPERIRLGLAGGIALIVVWAATARTLRGALLRGAVVFVPPAFLGVAILAALGLPWAFERLQEIVSGAPRADDEMVISVTLFVDSSERSPWLLLIVPVLVGVVVVAGHRVATRQRALTRGRATLLLAPFVVLAGAAWLSGAQAAALVAVIAGGWTLSALAHLAARPSSADGPGAPTPSAG